MFEVGRQYLFFACDNLEDGVGQQAGTIVAIDGPLLKVSRSWGTVEIINSHSPQFVRAEMLDFDASSNNDDDIPDDLIAPPTPGFSG
jgi:hypothetical protein